MALFKVGKCAACEYPNLLTMKWTEDDRTWQECIPCLISDTKRHRDYFDKELKKWKRKLREIEINPYRAYRASAEKCAKGIENSKYNVDLLNRQLDVYQSVVEMDVSPRTAAKHLNSV